MKSSARNSRKRLASLDWSEWKKSLLSCSRIARSSADCVVSLISLLLLCAAVVTALVRRVRSVLTVGTRGQCQARGVKAAMASSRGATWPRLVRTRPPKRRRRTGGERSRRRARWHSARAWWRSRRSCVTHRSACGADSAHQEDDRGGGKCCDDQRVDECRVVQTIVGGCDAADHRGNARCNVADDVDRRDQPGAIVGRRVRGCGTVSARERWTESHSRDRCADKE